MNFRQLLTGIAVGAVLSAAWSVAHADVTLLNVSYDPTRELYQEYNAAFAKHWKASNKEVVSINQSHGGSGKQARAVIDGLDADVVTLALGYDVTALSEKSLIPADWQKRLPNNASPYTSTIVFLVRKGNPKGIRDWNDLIKPGIGIVTPNPKTSGGARWNYLAAWAYELKQPGGNDEKAREFVGKLFKNVKVLDSGARGATTSFTERGIGDVLLVRKGNPKGIHDWEDVAKPGVGVITPNPKTSGGARWNFLAAWGYALDKWNGDEAKARELLRGIYKNAVVMDTGARGSTTTFDERGIGDVLIAWENEALLALETLSHGEYEIVVPSESILAEPPVALVDTVARRKGTTGVAETYLQYLYSPEAQQVIGKRHYRPSDPAVAETYAAKFPKLKLFTIEEKFGGWKPAQARFFAEGGIFDQVYQPGN